MGGGSRGGRRRKQQRRRRQHHPRLIPVYYAFANTSVSSSSLAGISGFSWRRPLSPCHSRGVLSDMRASPSFPAHRTCTCPELLHPRFLLSSYIGAIILYPLAPAHIASLKRSTTRQKVGQAVVSHRCPSAAHHTHGTHVCIPPFPVVPVAASLPLCAFLRRPLMTNLRNSTATLRNDRTGLTSDDVRSFVSKPTSYQQLNSSIQLLDKTPIHSLWLPVLIVGKSLPRDPRDPPYHFWRGLVHTNHTHCTESHSGCIQRIYGPPSDPEIRHPVPAAVSAANLGAGNSPRAGANHPRGIRTEFDRRLARRRPPGGAAATTHVCVCV
jgi:hypothetical protein